MSLRSINLDLPLFRRTGAIVASGFLILFAFAFMVLCLSQLSGGFTDLVCVCAEGTL